MVGLSNDDKEMLVRINEIMHYLWDPIGVSDEPYARDEYEGYAMHVFSMCKNNANREEIRDYLNIVITEKMGLKENIQHDEKVTSIIINTVEYFNNRKNIH